MNLDVASVTALAARYRLRIPAQPPRGIPGDHLSRSSGSSVEFHDFRPYVPGDDLRHIDWAAVARTDQLIVRLHRAELKLSVDVFLDTSRSLALFDGLKAARASELALLLATLARKLGARATVWAMGDACLPIREEYAPRLAALAFDGRTPLTVSLERAGVRPEWGSIRLVISDFLFPHDPQRLQTQIGSGAAAVAMLQLLAREEEAPQMEGHLRLLDAETGEEREMVLNREIVGLYRERLQRLQAGLATACRAAQGTFVRIFAEAPLEESCRDALVPQGLLEPA